MTATALAPAPPSTTTAPRRRPLARIVFWTSLAVVLVLVVLAIWAVGGAPAGSDHARSPSDPSPSGAMAVAEVLRQQGVDVGITHSLDATRRAIGDDRNLTLLVDDDWWALDAEAYRRLPAEHLVLVAPRDEVLETTAPGVSYAGFASGIVAADCELPAARRAERIDTGGDAYRAPGNAVSCFPSDGGGASLVRLTDGGREVTLLGASQILSNELVAENGNAALVLGLLGERPRLIWYQPDIDDLSASDDGTLAARQADWYLPLVVLLLLVALAAAFWRGRRMGPIVVEDLPVEVRSSETMEGRARLYERGGSRDHALDTLRAATVTRLSHALGLSRDTPADEVALAVAAVTGHDPAHLLALLETARAPDERSFVRLSDELLQLEQALARGIAPR